MRCRALLGLATTLMLAAHGAAASAAMPAPVPPGEGAAPSGFTAAGAVVRFATATQHQIDEEPRFNARRLREIIVAELTARGLLADPNSGRVIDIQIDEFSLRNTTNVVVFGNIASAGKLAAVLHVQSADGRSGREARVRVEAALNLRKGDDSPLPLEKLYRRLAVAIADELTGTPGTASSDAD